MKPLLVGEQNPYQRNAEDADRYALYPEPRRASGGRLCFDIMGLDERTYLRSFDRVDLCHPKWSLPEARKRAAELVAERCGDDVVVLCGAKVCTAFGVPFDPFTLSRARFMVRCLLPGISVLPTRVILPHPSGRCREWQKPGAFARARMVLHEAKVLPCVMVPLSGDDTRREETSAHSWTHICALGCGAKSGRAKGEVF